MAKIWFLISSVVLACLGGADLVRKNVDKLSRDEIYSLQQALRDAIADNSPKGYNAIAAYHGYPPQCKHGDRDVACCVHGDPDFPTWHRLLVVQVEQALKDKGLTNGIPYWDWTEELHDLPELVRENVLPNPAGGKNLDNPWYQGDIHVGDVVHHTSRAIDERLYQHVEPGEHTDLFEQVLHAFEYTSFCQFEVQFEVAHNYIHSLVGGRSQYSLSSLEYTVYDPIFFLHHSNVDRLLQIYAAVQNQRGIKSAEGERDICDIKGYLSPLEPFSRDSNPFPVTKENSSPRKAVDHHVFGYNYDSLTLNGLTAVEIAHLIKERQSHDRAFADFELHNIGSSADVRVKVCLDEDADHHGAELCKHAGDFFILGGPLEMSWSFARPYHFEITKTVQQLGIPLDGDYHVEIDVFHINGTQLPSNILPHPTVNFRPAVGKTDPPISHTEEGHEHEFHEDISIRKNIDRLTREEIFKLREALEKFQNDRSVDGYQATAEFHGEPGKCPFPTDKDRLACCVHGQATFPHWHRLIGVQVEDALRRRGSPIGLPYWDWARPKTHIPELLSDEKYTDPHTGEEHHNPFHDAEIAFLGQNVRTSRDVQKDLSQDAKWGDHTELFDAFLLALEQDNFCDFEVQFEIAHNLIHGLVGGNSQYGLSSLSYSAFDPIFYIHHSSIDRIWAIWTALQEHRHKPYKAHCAQSLVHTPLKPFAFSSPYNNNEKTFSHSTPTNIYDYEEELGYAYDSLEFGGMNIPELDDYINKHLKSKNRVFAGIQLHGIKKSGWATIYITPSGGQKYDAGHFSLLGGPTEMPWSFDHDYEHDITHALEALSLEWSDPYDVTVEIHEFNGTPIDASLFPKIHVGYKPAEVSEKSRETESRVRKNADHLTPKEVLELRHALTALEEDKSVKGYQTLGRYHGSTQFCKDPVTEKNVPCCLHGLPTFPHWHRLLAVQAENALRANGYHGGLPYWDWTQPLSALPDIVNSEKYVDPSSNSEVKNPFYSGHIEDVNHDTVRSVRPDLFQKPGFGEYTAIARQVLLALEQDDFCDFEVQFEIAHNFIHALVGGSEVYSLASLAYTGYDPLFYLHHSNTDRLWAIWQALQKYRGKPFNSANCAVNKIRKPLEPFSFSSDVNPDPVTREHSLPFQVFDYKANFHYEYDNLEFNGLTIPQLARLLEHNKGEDRVFAGFKLHGIKHSALTKFYICKTANDCDHLAGEFYLLGDENEMVWAYNRLYLYEITEQLEALHLRYDDRYTIKYEVHDLDGTDLGHPFPEPTVIHKVGTSHIYGREYRPPVTAASHLRRNLEELSPGEVESLRAAFLAIQKDHSYEKIASYHGKPGLCEHEGHKVACCVHGGPAFLPWHRLYVEQVEHVLLEHGSSVAVPYWDWTIPIRSLPELISEATYFNSRQQRFDPNPFFSGSIAGEDAVTTRNIRRWLFNSDEAYEQTLYALEQTHYCDFEVQLEVVHNALHSLIGGKARYSMSSLDYAAFDPVFFLHHSNTDRIWAIWQELQRYRGLPYNEADCAINLLRKPLKPFGDSDNKDAVTRKYSRPADTFDYRNHFDYEYDNLEFNHQTIPQLENLLQQRRRHGRFFAGLLIHNIGGSADVKVYICVPDGEGHKNCSLKAGVISILGGETEMPFTFNREFRLDISRAVTKLHLPLNSQTRFQLKLEIKAVNGSYLDAHILPDPSIIYVPGTDEVERSVGLSSPLLVRKNLESLSPLEEYHLLQALDSLNADSSADGFQSIASFHALPPLCPSPAASERHACCIHGGPLFLQWHRIYAVQLEDALKRHGSHVGLPYWDWTKFNDHLPKIFTLDTFTDPATKVSHKNPFAGGRIEFEHVDVERDVRSDLLFKLGPHGWDTWLYNQALYALEQEDFCDFAVQLEITHNSIHSWIGGSKEHSMAHLHYASYDPIFFIHHSNTDRLWAVWQALQKYRGHNPDEVNCALEKLREPLKPFSFGPPYNLNPVTQSNSRPEDTFAYETHFHYRYDALEFVGMNIPTLDEFLKERQEHDRVFAGFLLKGLHRSVNVDFDICNAASDNCFPAGYFSVLGGSAEMDWGFNSVYNYEITQQLKDHGFRYDDDYHFNIHVKAIDGTVLDSNLIHEPSVVFVPGKHDYHLKIVPVNKIRRNLNTLNERDIQSLQSALHELQEDNTNDGWANLASFHGAPPRCPDPAHPQVACCQHGMPHFPHWHRLFTVQIEQALERHGSSLAIPYWDWTVQTPELPSIFTTEDYYDVWKDEVLENPFAHGYIPSEEAYTVRDVNPGIFTRYDNNHTFLFYVALDVLEQTDYCDFEVQFEVLHNAIHYIIGGRQKYSLSSLEYSAYDPLFFIHHSFTDKIWVVWQTLQQRRHLPYNRADCAVNSMNEPMKPFSFEGFNLNKFTRDHAVPSTIFDHEDLGYGYDNLNIGGHTIEELENLIHERQSHTRVYAGFLLKGIKTSGLATFKLCIGANNCTLAGRFSLLGGPLETPWAFDRVYKREITRNLQNANLQPTDVLNPSLNIHVEVDVYDVEGHALSAKDVLPPPTIIIEPGHEEHEEPHAAPVHADIIRKDASTLTQAEIDNLREALGRLQHDDAHFRTLVSYHGSPAHCEQDHHPVACCIHGSVIFPHWHRLYVKEWEDELRAHGAKIGIPYWDWTTAFTKLPSLVTEETNNPFHHGVVDASKNIVTSRSPRDQLFNSPDSGAKSFFYEQILLAFEQTDYCDFEVQYEVTHNAIHSWTGGQSPYGMSTLEYTAFDPLFLLHHSNVDRQFAIWQALQKFRGLPYNSANCAIQLLRQPIRPFSDEDNYNSATHSHSTANDAFDYEKLDYHYDDIHFHGHTISELNDIIEEHKEHDRYFAEFLLHSIGTSADVTFELCDSKHECSFAGTFAILGGAIEMQWAFDHRFIYDITDAFHNLHLQVGSDYNIVIHIVAVNGTELDSHLVRPPSVRFVPGTKARQPEVPALAVQRSAKLLRKNVNDLTLGEATNLKDALRKLQNDTGPGGFEAIAGFHGAPFLCPESGDEKYACCVHGMPVFPHWHRLFTVQFEQALKEHGSITGIPYWDWTAPGRALPPFLTDVRNDNPFSSYTISFTGQTTTRSPLEALFSANTSLGHTILYELTLDALEEEDYCHFDTALEFLHNRVHFFIGGSGTYSMSTLDYSAFDPVFMIVHSSMDRIWVLWQELQKLRHKPYTVHDCGGHTFDKPLHPFDFPAVNTIALTRRNAVPEKLFDHSHLGYEYDDLAISGLDVQHVYEVLKARKQQTRIYFGEAVYGLGLSASFEVWVLNENQERFPVDTGYILGSSKEMPWTNEILSKYVITNAVKEAGLSVHKPIKFGWKMLTYNNQLIEESSDYGIVVVREGGSGRLLLVIPIGTTTYPLSPKLIVPKGTQVQFVAVSEEYNYPIENLVSLTNLDRCTIPHFPFDQYALDVIYDLAPGDYYFTSSKKELCASGKKIYIVVEDH